MTLDAELLEILVCPNDRGDLDYRTGPEVLVCRRAATGTRSATASL